MKPTIYVDKREKSVPGFLKKEAILAFSQLDIADYVLSENVGVERKTADDFLTSLMDGRLFDQMSRLKEAYTRPLLILEGDPNYLGRVHENAIRGALSFIMLDMGIPVYKFQADYLSDVYTHSQLGLPAFEKHNVVMWVEPNSGTVIDRITTVETVIVHPVNGEVFAGVVYYRTDPSLAEITALEAYNAGMRLNMLSDNTITVFEQDIRYSDDNIAKAKDNAIAIGNRLGLVEVCLPIISLMLGITLILTGTLINKKMQRE